MDDKGAVDQQPPWTECINSDQISIVKFKFIGYTGINYWYTILYLVCINDIVSSSNVIPFVLFSDNTTEYDQKTSIHNTIEIRYTEFGKVALWFD